MKAKKFLSMVIAAAMTMQCAAISVLADNTDTKVSGATVIANDIDTDWTLNWSWERYKDGFMYHTNWQLEDGYKMEFNKTKLDELTKYAYALSRNQTTNEYDTYMGDIYGNKYEGEYKVAYRTDADGNLVKYNAEDTTSTEHFWYHQGRCNYSDIAQFKVGEKTASDEPLVISYTYKSTNKEDQWYGNGPATAYVIRGEKGIAFRILPNNNQNKGLKIQCNNGTETVYKELGVAKDYNYHDVKVVISPELTVDGRYQMTAISVDGKVIPLENVYGLTAETSNKLNNITQVSGTWSSHTEEIKNLVVERGFDDITVTSSIADGATDVSDNVVLTFSEAVELASDAVKVYENGKAVEGFSVTQSDDKKTATVNIDEYKSNRRYRVVLDNTKVAGALGENVANGVDVTFTTAIVRNVVASDKATKWIESYSGDGREANEFYSNYDMKNGLKYELDSAKLTEFIDNYADVQKAKYYVDENGKFVNKNAENKTEKRWGWDGNWLFNEANFTVNEKVADADADKSLVISYTYKSTNKETAFYANGPATTLIINGNKGNDFGIYPNRSGHGLQIDYYDITGAKVENKQLGVARDDNYHDIKIVIAPEVKDGRYQMTAISVDGIVTELENVYGKTTDNTAVALKSLQYKSGYVSGNKALASYTDEIKNLEVVRGLDEIFVSSSIEDGAKEVKPENIKLSFTDAVKLADGAVKVLENGVEMSAEAYTLTPAADSKSVNLTIPEYKSRTAYKVVVDPEKVTGLLGGKLAEGLTFEFITAKKAVILEGSGENLAENYTITKGGYGGNGNAFTTVTTDEDGVTTITVDQAKWQDATVKNKDKKNDEAWMYDTDGDGIDERIGYNSWGFSSVKINGIADDATKVNNNLVISMEYSYENAGSETLWIDMNGNSNMFLFRPFGSSPKVSGKDWNGYSYTNNVSANAWHTVQYVIDPTIGTDGRTKVTQVTQDGTVAKDTTGNWASYSTAKEGGKKTLADSLQFRFSIMGAKDSEGNYLPTTVKIKNFKVLRAAELKAAADDNVLSAASNVLTVKFSDPVADLSSLKVLKGSTEVANAITNAVLAADGKSAQITMNLDTTARYSLVTDGLESVYGVKSKTNAVEFEYYNTEDFVSITNASKSDNGTDTTVSFTITASKVVNPLVIVAAYDSNNKLIKLETKSVNVYTGTDCNDNVTLAGVTGATKISVMAWDSLEGMTPYCLAKDIK